LALRIDSGSLRRSSPSIARVFDFVKRLRTGGNLCFPWLECKNQNLWQTPWIGDDSENCEIVMNINDNPLALQ